MAPNPVKRDVLIIGLISIGHGVSHFFHLILPPLFPWIKDAFDLSNAQLGFLMSVFFITSGVGQTLAGFFVDRYGAIRALLLGLTLSGIASLGFSLSFSYFSLIGFASLAGLGNSVFHPADYSLLNKKIHTKRLGHAYSTHGISGALGWAIAPVFLVGLTSLFNWRVAIAASSLVAFGALALLYINRRLLSNENESSDSELTPSTLNANGFKFLKLKAVWMCFSFFLISALAFGGIQSFAPAALSTIYPIPHTMAIAGITTYMLASAVGLLVGGFVVSMTDHHDRVIMLSLFIAGATAIITGLGLFQSWAVIPLLGIIGLGAGVAGPSRDMLVRAAAPKRSTGRVYGVVYSGLDIGLAIAPLIFGLLMDLNLSIWVFILIGLFQFSAILAATEVRHQRFATV